MIASCPALLARERQIIARSTESLAVLIAEETGAHTEDVRPWVAAYALMGVHQTLIGVVRAYLLRGPRDIAGLAREVRSQGRRALSLLEEGLGHYGATPAR
jgi:hypothetical protein